MGKLLATRLKNRRKELNLSQVELAKGICEQTQISRIERDTEYSPGAELIYALAKRLGVSMDYFFDEEIEADSVFLSQFRSLSKKFLEHRDYKSLKYIYELEVSKNDKLAFSDQLYLDWIETIVLFYVDHKQAEAKKKLEDIVSSYNDYDWDYLNLSNSLLIFYLNLGDNNKFEELYRHMLKIFDNTRVKSIEELEILIKCRYNFCRYLWLNNETERAISETLSTIDICLSHNTLYCLANLYCTLGNISEGFADLSKVKYYFTIAQYLYQLERNDKMSLELERYIKEVLN